MGGTRELIVSPYLIVYKMAGEVIHFARILHGAQRWP
jgi:plasmid stabilization system protein ParE